MDLTTSDDASNLSICDSEPEVINDAMSPYKEIETSFSSQNAKTSAAAATLDATVERNSMEKVIDYALQFLLRVFEIQLPSEEVTKVENVKALVRYICWTKNPSHRAGLILNRISK